MQPMNAPAPRRQPLRLAGSFFLLGAALTALWLHPPPATAPVGGLSASTRSRLEQLPAPVTIRFYSLLPDPSAAPLTAFAGRAAGLLDAIQAASGGQVRITRLTSLAETNANAASADGLQAFNLDQGDASFLGLTMASGKNRETLARLQPEWEPALEYDLIRAILRVTAQPAPPKPPPVVAQPSPETLATIHRLIPDVDATSVEAASQLFHVEFLKECESAGMEMEAQINAAQQQVIQAQNGGSQAEIEAARKHLLQVQMAQTDKVKQVATRLQTRLAVFQTLKHPAANNPD
jgi:hypothetical protein